MSLRLCDHSARAWITARRWICSITPFPFDRFRGWVLEKISCKLNYPSYTLQAFWGGDESIAYVTLGEGYPYPSKCLGKENALL